MITTPPEVDAGERAWRYEPLAPAYGTPLRSGGPVPTGTPPAAAAPTSRLLGAWLSLDPFVDGRVLVRAVHGVHEDSAGTVWLRALDAERCPPMFSLRWTKRSAPSRRSSGSASARTPKPSRRRSGSACWRRSLARPLTAPDAPERLATVLTDPECRKYVERLGSWLDAMITSAIGECELRTGGGAESFVLPLVARLHLRGRDRCGEGMARLGGIWHEVGRAALRGSGARVPR